MATVWHGIVKVQRSVFTNAPNQQFLIYDEARKIMYEGDIVASIERLFQPNELKFYAQATVEHGTLKVQHRVPMQAW